jgi:tetrahydromethanopterin S-methyltransferase subunit A
MSRSISAIAGELEAALHARKCHACGCFKDAVDALRRTALAPSLESLLDQTRSVLVERRYDCLGCEVCWPAHALNIAAEVVDLPIGAGCPTDVQQPREGWPAFTGDYQVIRFTAPVAVCTLHSRGLIDDVAQAAPEGLSIVGSLQTENLGIERLIENVVSNPNLRFLVLCGEDTPGAVGHFPGQSLVTLDKNGTDERGRIHGADGGRRRARCVRRFADRARRRGVRRAASGPGSACTERRAPGVRAPSRPSGPPCAGPRGLPGRHAGSAA